MGQRSFLERKRCKGLNMASFLFRNFYKDYNDTDCMFSKGGTKGMFIEVLVITLIVWFVVQDLRDRRK